MYISKGVISTVSQGTSAQAFISSGGSQLVLGTAASTVVSAGGRQTVVGIDKKAVVGGGRDAAVQEVVGRTSSASIRSGGSQVLMGGGLSLSATVSSGGVQVLKSASMADFGRNAIPVMSGNGGSCWSAGSSIGVRINYGGFVVSETLRNNGGVLLYSCNGSGATTSDDGGTSVRFSLKNHGSILSGSGTASASYDSIPITCRYTYSHGALHVTGSASGSYSGLQMRLNLQDTSITGSAWGYVDGCYCSGTVSKSGDYLVASGYATVNGQKYYGTESLYYPEYDDVYNEAKDELAAIESDYRLYSRIVASLASPAVASGTCILAGGKQLVKYGTAKAASVHGLQYVYAGGTASASIIRKGGCQVVSSGGSAVRGTIAGGGRQIVRSGGMAVSATASSGAGILVSSGGLVSAAYLGSGAVLTVYGRGKALGIRAESATAVVSRGGTVSFASGGILAGRNSFNGARASASNLHLYSGASLALGGGNTLAIAGLQVHSGASLSVSGTSNTLSSISLRAAAGITFDIRKISASPEDSMLALSKTCTMSGTCTVNAARRQQAGVYGLASGAALADGSGVRITIGKSELGTAAPNGTALSAGGVKYTAKLSGGRLTLTVANLSGTVSRGTAAADILGGTNRGDVFFGGRGDDCICGAGGRDTVVYGNGTWGDDVIDATTGTMDIVFINSITQARVASSYDAGTETMTLTRLDSSGAVMAGNSITISGWSTETHGIVYAGTMSATTAWAAASRPTAAQEASARREIWTKTGLLAG